MVRDQAQVLAKVLREGTPLGREGILNALWDFHIRHYALPELKADTVSIGLPAVLTKYVTGVPDLHRPGYEYSPYRETVDFKYDVRNGFFQTRIGNDSDLIHFFKSSGPELEDALLACLKDANDSMKIEVLKAGSTLSEAGDARFSLPEVKSIRHTESATTPANVSRLRTKARFQSKPPRMLRDKPDILAAVPGLRPEQASRQYRYNGGRTSAVSNFGSSVQLS